MPAVVGRGVPPRCEYPTLEGQARGNPATHHLGGLHGAIYNAGFKVPSYTRTLPSSPSRITIPNCNCVSLRAHDTTEHKSQWRLPQVCEKRAVSHSLWRTELASPHLHILCPRILYTVMLTSIFTSSSRNCRHDRSSRIFRRQIPYLERYQNHSRRAED